MNAGLNQLKIFFIAAKLKNFTHAAEALFLTQPGISKHIKHLEDQYNVRLFDRVGKKMILTHPGEILFEYADKIFNLVDRAEEEITKLNSLRIEELKLVSSATIGMYLLPEILNEFYMLYPDCMISLDINSNQKIVKKILDNSDDIGMIGEPADHDGIVIKPFYMDELVVIVPKHKWVKKSSVEIEDILNENLIISGKGSGTRTIIENRLCAHGISIKRTMEFGNTEAIKKAVEAGLGVSIISKTAITRELQLGLIRYIPISDFDLTRNLYVIHRKDKRLNTIANNFLEFILRKSQYKDDPSE